MSKGKKKNTKMSLTDFLGGPAAVATSWADDVELPTAPAASGDGSRSGGYGGRGDDARPRPEDIPTRGPFTSYVGNLPFDVSEDDIQAFFSGCNVLSVRIPMNHDSQRPKGYCYVEFKDRDSLIKGLDCHGKDLRGRSLRINLAEQRESDDKTSGNWRRQGGSSHESDAPKPADTSSSWRRTGPPPPRENGFAPLSSDRFGRDGQEVRGPKVSQADNVSSWRSSGTPRAPTAAFESKRNDSAAPASNSAPTGERKRLVLQPRSKPLE
ncbi:Eukaryotic translation initiation factor 4B [Entomophthora muscae]|uniref:Eukaryotic translation initiation factor 4B n=1 Tax=Entomophthora muscae TaxID=34485 RepID=A0ACC2SV74_9FUNG|nr:Eukaryotic translation initiation factor 4B [Entomophthora muscae]